MASIHDKQFSQVLSEFSLMEVNDNWNRFSNPRYYYINKKYKGKETIVIKSSPKKILEFLKNLYEFNSDLLKYVKEFDLRYWVGNEFRGWGGDVSYLSVDKEFAEKIELKGYFHWEDRAWGNYSAHLEYDLSKLNEAKSLSL